MMSESKNRKEFTKNLLAQDLPSADKQLRHKEALLKRFKRRIWLGKIIGGAIYIALFSVAFWAFMQRENTDNVVHSICWGTVSLHILLWFLIYFLRAIYRTLAEIIEKSSDGDEKPPWRNQDRFITIVAILVFTFSTILLYRSFSLTDPLKAAHLTAHILWATVFFIFWYPFGTASLLAKLWLRYKKMELNISNSESSG
jgi:magnesium-transporting ATPase (P-type)